MALNKNFIPIFDISSNLADGLRTIKTAEALTAGWYKGQFDYHLRKAGLVTVVNGEEYYMSALGLLYYQAQFDWKGTAGYHVAEFLRLIGFTDEDLFEIKQTAYNDSVDGIYQTWKRATTLSKESFRMNLEDMRKELVDVDSIQIDYENQKYKQSAYPTSDSRVYNTKQSIYGDFLQWGSLKGSADNYNWTDSGRVFNLGNIITRTSKYAFGTAIRFYKDGVDVSASYSVNLKSAVQSMIMYSGNEFMQRTASVKTGEKTYTVKKYTITDEDITDTYISALGTETFDSTIKSAFLSDEDNRHFIRYTVVIKNTSISKLGTQGKMYLEVPWIEEGRSQLNRLPKLLIGSYDEEPTYPASFWSLIQEIEANKISTDIQNVDLFYDTRSVAGLWIKVNAFKKLSIEEILYTIQRHFDIRVTTQKGSTLEWVISGIAKALGRLFDIAFMELMLHPEMKYTAQILTKFGNHVLSKDETKEEYGRQISGAVLAVLGYTFGWTGIGMVVASIGMALATSGSEVLEKQKEAESKAEEDKLRKKIINAENKKKQDSESMREMIKSKEADNEQEEFQKFLRNPMHKVDEEKRRMDSELRSQFKLL